MKKTKGIDYHHVFFPRTSWNRGSLGKLRSLFKIEINKDTHRRLHQRIPFMPPMTEFVAERLLRRLPPHPTIDDLISHVGDLQWEEKNIIAGQYYDSLLTALWAQRNIIYPKADTAEPKPSKSVAVFGTGGTPAYC